MSTGKRHPDYQTFAGNIKQTCKRLREPAGQFGKSAVLCADAAVTIEKLQSLCCDAYAVIDVLAGGVGKITTPDGFFALWNETSIRLERTGAKPFKERTADNIHGRVK